VVSEHDRHFLLELKQNSVALDPREIIPWSKEAAPEGPAFRLQEALFITVLQLEMLEEKDVEKKLALETIRHDLELDQFVDTVMRDAHERARKVVKSKGWTHVS
jgi:hypothetical protein